MSRQDVDDVVQLAERRAEGMTRDERVEFLEELTAQFEALADAAREDPQEP